MTRPALVICLVTACGGGNGSTDVEPTLRFADRTDLEISRLVSAASGSEGFQAQGQISQFDDPFEPDPCPTVVEDLAANRVTISGGCTMTDGTAIEGSAELTNPLGWGDLDYDFNSSSILDFSDFAFVTPGGRIAYDGAFRIGPSYSELDMDLTVESFGVTVRSDVFMDCDRTTCSIGKSGLELIDAGGVLVSGRIAVAGQSTVGNLTLRGVDTVKVTIANGCVSWQLEGTDRGSSPCQ